jgi:hypothetical protein
MCYLFKNKTVFGYTVDYNFLFGTDGIVSTILGTVIYIVILILMFIVYLKIVKNSDKFLNIKNMILAGIFVGLTFAICFPNTSSDLFYYMGSGRILGKYGENPYFITIADLLKKYPTDGILLSGGVWSKTTVVYGPVWVLITAILNKISFNSITLLMYSFKLCNLVFYILIAYLIYKISNKKKFVAIYLFNPLILLEFLVNAHNDVYMIFFCLLGIYFIKNKKNIWFGLISIAIATAIKYISVLFLPFLILYYLKDKSLNKKIVCGVLYTIVFAIILILMYMPWFNSFADSIKGIFLQQGKCKDSIYALIIVLSNNNTIISFIFSVVFYVFLYYLIIKLLFLLFRKITFKTVMENIYVILIIVIFGLLTNLTSWYLSWLFIPICWLKSKNVKNIMYLSLFYELTYALFFIVHSDSYVFNMWILPMIGFMFLVKVCIEKIVAQKKLKKV